MSISFSSSKKFPRFFFFLFSSLAVAISTFSLGGLIINKLLITNGEVDSAKRVTELKSTVNNITVKGLSAIPTFLSQDSKYLNASNLILTNKESIVEEAIAWFNTAHSNVHNEIQIQKCSRDTGYNIDAIVTDLQNGGNFETIAVATRYWEGTSVN